MIVSRCEYIQFLKDSVLDFNEDKFRSEINKSKINPNEGMSIEDQLRSAFGNPEKPQVKEEPSPKLAAKKVTRKRTAIKTTTKPVVIKAPANRNIPLSNDNIKLIHRANSGETLSSRDYCRKVIRMNETVILAHVLAEEGKVFTEKSILNNYGDSLNSVAHMMALCKVKQEGFEFTDKETLMLIGEGGNTVAHLIARSGNIERMSFTDIEIFRMRNDKGESVANLLHDNGIKFTHTALDSIRKEIFEIIAA